MMVSKSSFRLGELAELLDQRAAEESEMTGRRVTPSALVKRALQIYLAEDVQQHIDANQIIEAVKGLRIDLSRVGGNLNQIAHGFNVDGRIIPNELQQVHRELQKEFGKIAPVLREIEKELYGRR